MCKEGEHLGECEDKELAGLGRDGRESRRPRRSAEAREERARKTGLPSIRRRGRMCRQPVLEEEGRRRWSALPRARCGAARRRRLGGPGLGEGGQALGFKRGECSGGNPSGPRSDLCRRGKLSPAPAGSGRGGCGGGGDHLSGFEV